MPSKPWLWSGVAALLACCQFAHADDFSLIRLPSRLDTPTSLSALSQANASVSSPLTHIDFLRNAIDSASIESPRQEDSSERVMEQVLYKTPRMRIANFAMKLRDIRYRRGGHEPSTGFDCSGFVHYVYSKTFNLDLPYDAPSQYNGGRSIARSDLKTGDLVFFHEGKHISHVGIYLGDGHFIHSPSPGKYVRVDRLDASYWVKRYAGAKRPDVLS